MKIYCALVLSCVLVSETLLAQVTRLDNQGNQIAPYYIDFSKSEKATVHDISQNILYLEYNDHIGKSTEINLTLVDWKKNVVAEFLLAKSFGLNHFVIDLPELQVDQIYLCKLTFENNASLEVQVRPRAIIKKEIVADILVRPRHLNCDGVDANAIEYYSSITGGKAPYIVNWYVLNNTRTNFLYQPKEERVTGANTSWIEVNQSPDYYVLMYVRDACGNEQKKSVHILCEDGQKKVNTVFFEINQQGPSNTSKLQN